MTIDLEQSGYRRVASNGLWMRGDDSAKHFDYNDGDEFENWVAQTIQGATDVRHSHARLSTAFVTDPRGTTSARWGATSCIHGSPRGHRGDLGPTSGELPSRSTHGMPPSGGLRSI
jgi:hypothetical protein